MKNGLFSLAIYVAPAALLMKQPKKPPFYVNQRKLALQLSVHA
jgi:uncharacterized membrane protein